MTNEATTRPNIEEFAQIRFVTAEPWALTGAELLEKAKAMLASVKSGKLWVGNLEEYRDDIGHRIQGRQITRRTLVSSWTEVAAQIISLLDEEIDTEAEPPFGEDGTSKINGVLVHPFYEGETTNKLEFVVDCVNPEQKLFIAYIPDDEDHDRGLNAARCYRVEEDGSVCYAD
ncbi:hypothetical protein KKF55_00025 [Patescibacteria group bacterium]|nr:hypothetical protein [Patescibacteria group bacterium]